MVFSSTLFLFLFLPIVLIVHFLVPRGLRNHVLLVASLLFYAWGEVGYFVLMLASIMTNWFFGLVVARHDDRRDARWAVALSVVVNLALLGWYKYGNFLADNLSPILVQLGLPAIQLAPIPLPIGISFYTFQAMSYVIDVHRGEAEVQRNPLHTALYVSLFPQLIAGPIVRYHDVATQIASRVVTSAGFAEGIRRFSIGLAKKVLIANAAAVPADAIFALPPETLSPATAWLGAICYTLQIYFDFSGYSDMAIGLGHMFGFTFLENFNYPYVSRSITEFWRRWHMSLSTWFRDYLYIPLGGNRKGPVRTYFNLFLVFFLCGLWHGASWAFVAWGAYHGVFLVLERAIRPRLRFGFPRIVAHAYTLLVVLVGWVFFRAATLEGAVGHLSAMAGLAGAEGIEKTEVEDFVTNRLRVALAFGVIGSTPFLPVLARHARRLAGALPRGEAGVAFLEALGGAFALAILFLSALELAASTHNPFIYFRF